MALELRLVRFTPALAALLAGVLLVGCGPGGLDDGDDGGDGDGSADTGDGDADSGDGDGDGGTDWSSCRVPSDCELAANTCCGTCGVPTLDDVDAINGDQWQAHYDEVCDDPDPICPGCAAAPNPWLTATCTAQTCEAVDLSTHPANECIADTDCRVRTPLCCECGAPTEPGYLIGWPIDGEQSLSEAVCDPNIGCPECAPTYPDDVEAYCDEGRCAVRVL